MTPPTEHERRAAKGQLRAGLTFVASLFAPVGTSFAVVPADRPARLIAVSAVLLATDSAMVASSRSPSSQGVLRPWSWRAYAFYLAARLPILIAMIWAVPRS